jgi:hypothetical protein
MNRNKIVWWIIFILLFIWQLPQNIVAIVMLPFLGKLKLVRNDKYCFAFEAKKMSGGITLGSFIFLSPSCAKRDAIVLHEYGHVVQSHMLSWLYLIVIGLPSLMWATFHGPICYYRFYTESWANKISGLKVNDYCTAYIPE